MFKSDSKGLESKAPTMSSVALLEASYALGKRGATENVDKQIGELLMAAKTIDDQHKEEENPPPARFSRLQQAAIGVGTVAAVGLAALIAVAVRSMANPREDDDES